jgi:apolipoprotein N-acyltransferase
MPSLPQGWIGVDTRFGGRNGEYAGYQQQLNTIDRVRDRARGGASMIVLPESAVGVWTPTIERLWVRALQDLDATVFGGAVMVDQTGYKNVMLELSAQGAVVHYQQRIPVPVSMWQPWLKLVGAPAGARADLFANPIVTVRGTRVATLICYEQLLIWPVLHSAIGSPDLLLAPSNGWWTANTNIVAIQIATTTAWASLFELPLVMAINS